MATHPPVGIPPDFALVIVRPSGGRRIHDREGQAGDGDSEYDFAHGIPLGALTMCVRNNLQPSRVSNRSARVNGKRLLRRNRTMRLRFRPDVKRFVFLVSLSLVGCAAIEPTGGTPVALVNASGQSIGSVRAWQTAGGVTFRIDATRLPHGIHGIHVHSIGRCDPPDFTSAGPHWNPGARKHGMNNPAGPHAGDLPNVEAAANGVLATTV